MALPVNNGTRYHWLDEIWYFYCKAYISYKGKQNLTISTPGFFWHSVVKPYKFLSSQFYADLEKFKEVSLISLLNTVMGQRWGHLYTFYYCLGVKAGTTFWLWSDCLKSCIADYQIHHRCHPKRIVYIVVMWKIYAISQLKKSWALPIITVRLVLMQCADSL